MTIAPYRYRIIVEQPVIGVSGKAINVWNVGNDTALSDTAVTNCLNHLKTFYNAIATYLPGTFSIGARVLEFRPGLPAPRIVGVAAVAQSSASSSPYPPQLAAVIAWRTALAGRRYRGRTFLGPLNAAAFNGQALNGTFTTLANSGAATLITNIKTQTAAAWGLVVHSDAQPDDTQVTSGFMSGKVMTVRSRN